MSRLLHNDPGGSSSAFSSFLLINATGSWSRTAADDAADARLEEPAAALVTANADGLRPFAIRSVNGRRGSPLPAFLAGRVGSGDDLRSLADPPTVDQLAALAGSKPDSDPGSKPDSDPGSDPGRDPGSAPHGAAAINRVGEPYHGPLIGVCTNGSRDRCCAISGRPIAKQLTAAISDQAVVEISHLGGHRFAGTMLVLPWGYSYGLLDPDSAAAVADDLLEGNVYPHQLRGRANLSPAAQAAEIAWRQELGPAPPDAVVITGESPLPAADGGYTEVAATVDGRPESLRVQYQEGRKVIETACGGKPFVTGRWVAAA